MVIEPDVASNMQRKHKPHDYPHGRSSQNPVLGSGDALPQGWDKGIYASNLLNSLRGKENFDKTVLKEND